MAIFEWSWEMCCSWDATGVRLSEVRNENFLYNTNQLIFGVTVVILHYNEKLVTEKLLSNLKA